MSLKKPFQVSDFQRGPFPAHGDATVTVEGRVMRFCAIGPWNLAFMEANRRAMLQAARALPADGRFADLVEIQGSALMTPEALAHLTTAIDAAVAQGFRSLATAVVMGLEVEGRALMLPKICRVYSRHRPVSVHTTVEDALAHLRGLMPDLGA